MKLELFEEVSDTLAKFINEFVDIPSSANKYSIAWQRFHYNFFKSMTTSLFESMLHLNYATLLNQKKEIQYAQAFSIVVDSNYNIINTIDFDTIDETTQYNVMDVVITECKGQRDNWQENKYHFIKFNCLNRKNKLCTISGTVLKDVRNNKFIFNLFYINIKTNLNDVLLEIDYYTKDKKKYNDLYHELISINNITESKLYAILEDKGISKTTFNDDFMYFYGDTFWNFYNKERYIRGLQLLFFTKDSLYEIATQCGFKSIRPMYVKYIRANHLKKHSLIRYSNMM
ncbi:hypothetical protein [Myroides phaeus]|uniref:hypothetical protein n=1 Tax=Myroides phaeus TaxID=702745 RepID=UPI0013036039|nr:hypothetical protein [Myroides phaeus]